LWFDKGKGEDVVDPEARRGLQNIKKRLTEALPKDRIMRRTLPLASALDPDDETYQAYLVPLLLFFSFLFVLPPLTLSPNLRRPIFVQRTSRWWRRR
jgi:hypothetical protein